MASTRFKWIFVYEDGRVAVYHGVLTEILQYENWDDDGLVRIERGVML